MFCWPNSIDALAGAVVDNFPLHQGNCWAPGNVEIALLDLFSGLLSRAVKAFSRKRVKWKTWPAVLNQTIEDFKLIDMAVGGDDKAYAKLLQRYKRPVYHMILKMVRNVDDAEDLTIESFAKAFLVCHGSKRLYVQHVAVPDRYEQFDWLYRKKNWTRSALRTPTRMMASLFLLMWRFES